MTVECHLCQEPFEASEERVRAWADSGRPFDPTDWECPDCCRALADILFFQSPEPES